jgi:glycosyltransferase involved in cell wall biosynthesis
VGFLCFSIALLKPAGFLAVELQRAVAKSGHIFSLPPGYPMKSLIVEGWRGINHSYAMVNQFQLLELRKRGLDLSHVDVPFYNAKWSQERNGSGFADSVSKEIFEISPPADNHTADVCYRISFPYRFSPSACKRIYVFGTSEFQNIDGHTGIESLREGLANPDLKIITCSNWSAVGFHRAGFDESRVLVVPLGIDPQVFRPPSQESRAEFRQALKIRDGEFAILSVGAMTANKGTRLLVFAYALLRKKYPEIRLVLKDQANLYNVFAKDVVNQLKKESPHLIDDALDASIVYISQNVSLDQLRGLYGAVDCYASPYLAEGFNLTPLEAAACGTPIVVTQWGATDDYVDESFALQIESVRRSAGSQCWLEPNLDSLVEQISRLVERRADRIDSDKAIEYIRRDFSWSSVVTLLLRAIFD